MMFRIFILQMMKNTKNIYVGQVDCVAEKDLCQQEQIQSYPNVRLYPPGAHSGSGSYQ